MRFPILLVFLLSMSFSQAQLTDPAVSISVEPTLGHRIMNFKSKALPSFKDSINKADVWRDAISANFMISYATSRYSRIFFGLQFQNFGYTRSRKNLKFMDTIHEDIGIVNDLSQTGSNDVEYIYRYQYLGLPVMLSSKLNIKRMKTSKMYFMFGGSLNILINHDIRTKLIGFSARGKKVFILDGKEDEPSRFNASLQMGLRLENPILDKNTFIFIQPDIYLPILRANKSDMKAQLYAFGLQIGVVLKLDKDKA